MAIDNSEEQLVEQELDEALVEGSAPPPSRPAVKKGRFVTNFISNGVLFGFNVILGLWYVPYLIRHLGMAGYGIVPLATQLVGYMAVVTLGLNAAVGRYITIELERGNDESANRYFNTSFFGSVIMAVLLLIPASCAALYVDRLINVPADDLIQARWLFACVVIVFLMNTVRMPFSVSLFSLNRFDLTNWLNATNRIVSIGVVVLCFNITAPQIWNVGLGLVIAAMITWIGTVWFWRRLTPQLHVAIRHFDIGKLRSLISMGSWVSINSIGAILFLYIDLLVINRMMGPEAGGRYAAVAQWSVLLRTMGGMIVGLFGPTMLYYYARRDIDGLALYGRQAVKIVGLLMALPIGLICGLSSPLLQTWLGPKFMDLNWLMSLMAFHLCVNIAVIPLFGIQNATKRVIFPAIVTIVLGFGNLGLAILFTGPTGWGVYGPAAAGAIALTTKNIAFTTLHAAHALNRRWDTFLWELLPIVIIAIGTTAVGKLISLQWNVSGWFRLAAVVAVLSVAYAAVGYWGILSREDRKMMWNMVPSFSFKRQNDRA